MRLIISCVLLGLLSLPASAEIYRYTDANGNSVFTNQPPDGVPSEAVKLQPANSIQPPPNIPSPASADTEEPATAAYDQLQLIGLPSDEALRANNGSFSVDVAIDPALQPGHRLRLLLDGQPYGTASSSTRLQLINIDRGEHSLAVEVLSGDRSIQQSDAVNVTVLRVNIHHNPALHTRPHAPKAP